MADFKWKTKGPVDAAVRKAVRMAAGECLAHAVAICPQDTGTLARSITMQMIADDHARVGTPIHYAPFVEFGTRRMAAQPFLGPALAQAKRKYG